MATVDRQSGVGASSSDGESQRRFMRDKLRAVVLLSGSVRPSELDRAIGRSLLDLPVDESGTLLDHWRGEVAGLADDVGLAQLPLRVMISRNAPHPSVDGPGDPVPVAIEEDPADFRGTGGLLRDAVEQYDDDDYLLVVSGAQLLLRPLAEVALGLAQVGGDVVVVSHNDGTPGGVMLLRCQAVRSISPKGFVDLKEQSLPAIAESFRVNVLDLDEPSGVPIRTTGDYLGALRRHYRRLAGEQDVHDAFAETWQAMFRIVEPGATVAPDARVHNSVVLAGARVDGGAVVVNSVVPPGQVVRRRANVIDQLAGSKAPGNGRR